MPKAPPTFANHASSRAEAQLPLKRNQACHQCRRRKLKCDAKRPACSTCIRSHAHAVAHAAPGTQLPSEPDCSFDYIVDPPIVNDVSKTPYEKLETRIQELEALLLEKQLKSSSSSPSLIHAPTGQFLASDIEFLAGALTQSPPVDELISPAVVISTPGSSPRSSSGLEIFWPNYPPGVPTPELLHHLVDAFFMFHPHAKRVIHYPSFMAALVLSPSHPKFPSTSVLHAICAVGSLYTSAVTSPPVPNFVSESPDEIFSQRQRLREGRPDSFAEQQAKYARDAADHEESIGERLFEMLQARTILTWFYWFHSRWLEVFTHSSHCLRISVPLGLNVCPPFHSITHSLRPASLISPARTVVEDETRRNMFWLAYCTERLHGCSNGWAMTLDDQDVSQLLPVRGDHYEKGVLVAPVDRQWAHTRDLLLVHLKDQTDSFVLFVKGVMIISRAKAFNFRFRSKYFHGDPSVISPHAESIHTLEPVDPRGSPAFTELDNIASSFRSSFPSHLRNPILGNVVDQHLYAACLMPLVATILLHDPHANVRRSGCISALKLIRASRSILDLAYDVFNTSFDVTLLDPFCSYCWFMAGRVLVRFLQAAIEANTPDRISTIRAELDFLEAAISKIGQRVPLAFRYAKMLNDLVATRCGPAESTQATVSLTFPRPQDFDIEMWIKQTSLSTHGLHESLGLQGSAGTFLAVS